MSTAVCRRRQESSDNWCEHMELGVPCDHVTVRTIQEMVGHAWGRDCDAQATLEFVLENQPTLKDSTELRDYIASQLQALDHSYCLHARLQTWVLEPLTKGEFS